MSTESEAKWTNLIPAVLLYCIAAFIGYAFVLLIYNMTIHNGSQDQRNNNRANWAQSSSDSLNRIQLQGFEREILGCLARTKPSRPEFNRLGFLTKPSAHKAVLMDEERCVTQTISSVAMGNPEAAAALAFMAKEAGYQVSRDISSIAVNNPEALRSVAGYY